MRKEINYLLNKGYLKEILGRKNFKPKDLDQGLAKILHKAVSRPWDAKVSKMEKEEGPKNKIATIGKNEITFSDDERENILDLHHDGLVPSTDPIHCKTLCPKNIGRWG